MASRDDAYNAFRADAELAREAAAAEAANAAINAGFALARAGAGNGNISAEDMKGAMYCIPEDAGNHNWA
eukprot:10014313-Heterocapsa_arctica.AAC.1